MRTDFTPQRLFNPTTNPGGTPTPNDVALVEKLANLYERILKINTSQARQKAEEAKQQGTLNEELKIYQEILEDIAFQSDYIFRSFNETTKELKNQNVILALSKSSFKKLSDISSDINYFQKGSLDLTDKQLKKMKGQIQMREDDLAVVVKRFKSENVEARIQNLLSKDRSEDEEKRLQLLLEQKKAYEAAKNAVEQVLPSLKKELEFSKNIAETREELGGLAAAAAGTISKYGGSLAQFLNFDAAKESAEEYNKKLIDNALKRDDVLDALHANELKRLDLESELEGLTGDARINKLKEIDNLEKDNLRIKQEAINSVNNLGNKFKSLGVFTKELGAGLKKSLTDPVTLITFFVGKALDANKQTVELGKALGYAGGKAELYRESIAAIARGSGNIFATTENLVESFNELAQATGFVYEYSADQLLTQTKLTKQVGLQADEAAQIQRFAVVTGKTSEETYKSFVRGLTATRNQLKVGINFKAALAEAAKVSGQLAAQLGYNPERIAKAVVTAKAFGMTLDQVAKSGESLLNFEQSIESELKAELLTGKQLNLERARAAALAGDQVALAEELAKNVGTAAEFTKMNTLQQKALAESVGMTADELSETLRKREEAIASGKSLAQVTEEEAAKALERNNIQDKFNQAILKLQDFFGNLIAGPLGTILDMLTEALSIVTLIASPFQLIYDLTSMIGSGLGSLINSLGIVGKLIKGVASAAIIYAAYKAYANLATIPIIGIGLGAAAAAGITAAGFGLLNSKKGDDVMSEGGYGKRTLLAPEGAIKLNDKDTVIAGTNLGGGEGGGTMPSIDLTPMVAAINEVRAAVDRLYSKDTSINMDGKKVGSTLVQGSYKVA